jgi:transcriptional antiterminator RfaH
MKQWYALRSKPKKEPWVASLLSRIDIEVYLPQVAVAQHSGKPALLQSFFPGYLFARLDPLRGELNLVRYTSGVLEIVGYGGEPWPVPDDLILALRKRIAGGQRLVADFQPGEQVLITSGPFKEVEAIFDRHLSSSGRAQVLVWVLQRLCRAEVRVGQLQRGKAARRALA